MGALRRKAAVVLAGAGAVSLLTAGAAGAVPGVTPVHGPQPKPVPQSTMVPGTGCTLGQVEKALAKEDPSGWEEINEAPPLKANFERIIVLTPEQRAAKKAQWQKEHPTEAAVVQFLRDNNMFDAPQEKIERKATWQRVKATCAKY
jgi:hemophore-related protein